jgi:hypothetical protein
MWMKMLPETFSGRDEVLQHWSLVAVVATIDAVTIDAVTIDAANSWRAAIEIERAFGGRLSADHRYL